MEGLPEEAKPSFSLQLSSPIEELAITKIFDPADEAAEGSVATFQGVETSNATLTASAKDADIPLGSSASMDVAPLCNMSDLSQPQFVTETKVEIFPEEESGEEGAEKVAVCTVTFKVTYKPSAQDHREELYELLNKASETKNKYVAELNQAAKASSRQVAQPAVKRGFLDKPPAASKKKKKSKVEELYQKYLGPESFVRVYVPLAKNYLMFFGAITFFHFRGQFLALPPPV